MGGPEAHDEADERQYAIYRRMSPAERARVAADLYYSARRFKGAYLRTLHPDWSEGEILAAVKEAFLHARD
jgi:hypothetical protein